MLVMAGDCAPVMREMSRVDPRAGLPRSTTRTYDALKLPMYGFTESLNLSVSVAICLNILISKLHNSASPPYISGPEKDILRLNWYRKIVRGSEIIEREFLRTID